MSFLKEQVENKNNILNDYEKGKRGDLQQPKPITEGKNCHYVKSCMVFTQNRKLVIFDLYDSDCETDKLVWIRFIMILIEKEK